jgi:type III secretion protein N (ATPase)
MNATALPDSALAALLAMPTVERRGRVHRALGTSLTVSGLDIAIGETCEILGADGAPALLAEVVGFSAEGALLAPLAELRGLAPGAEVRAQPRATSVPTGKAVLGRVLDALGQPIDGGPSLAGSPRAPLHSPAPDPLARPPIATPLETGIRAIDTLLTVGVGQRLGVFAAAGGGKSTLLGMLARFVHADAVVVALIGERGREVREFMELALGPDGLARTALVVATAERSALERARAAATATAIAEGLRAQGLSVLLLVDSITRYARSLREIGLAAGEPPVRRGFPPSVFAELPRLFERAGCTRDGSITAFYTVLVEDEAEADPIAEEVRSLLDGHIILARKLGETGHYPAIDVLASLSRLFPSLASASQRAAAQHVRTLLSRHAEVAFLVQLGEYKPGGDLLADRALELKPAIDRLLRQDSGERADGQAALVLLRALAPIPAGRAEAVA